MGAKEQQQNKCADRRAKSISGQCNPRFTVFFLALVRTQCGENMKKQEKTIKTGQWQESQAEPPTMYSTEESILLYGYSAHECGRSQSNCHTPHVRTTSDRSPKNTFWEGYARTAIIMWITCTLER